MCVYTISTYMIYICMCVSVCLCIYTDMGGTFLLYLEILEQLDIKICCIVIQRGHIEILGGTGVDP